MTSTDSSPSSRSPLEAARWLGSLENAGMRFGLERMHALLERLGHPEAAFDAVHVVGTNGKSSTVRFVEALLEAEGVRTGAYLSPHVSWLGMRERIRTGGEPIADAEFARAVLDVRGAADEITQFEAVTAAAFLAFARAEVEWAVVEAGLGGRLDATNVLPRSRVQVLTNVDLDHTDLLGETREAIAAEKLAVVPPGGALVLGEDGWQRLAPQAGSVRVAGAAGGFQDQNRAVALAAAEVVLGRPPDPAALDGVTLPGRLEWRGERPLEVWDGAHNPAGMARLVRELRPLLDGRPLVAVLSVLRDKDAAAMVVELRTLAREVVVTQSSNPRSLPAGELAAVAGGPAEADPVAARELARRRAGAAGAVVVCGSLYLLHDLHVALASCGTQTSEPTVRPASRR